jgi:hypothetical protein
MNWTPRQVLVACAYSSAIDTKLDPPSSEVLQYVFVSFAWPTGALLGTFALPKGEEVCGVSLARSPFSNSGFVLTESSVFQFYFGDFKHSDQKAKANALATVVPTRVLSSACVSIDLLREDDRLLVLDHTGNVNVYAVGSNTPKLLSTVPVLSHPLRPVTTPLSRSASSLRAL